MLSIKNAAAAVLDSVNPLKYVPYNQGSDLIGD